MVFYLCFSRETSNIDLIQVQKLVTFCCYRLVNSWSWGQIHLVFMKRFSIIFVVGMPLMDTFSGMYASNAKFWLAYSVHCIISLKSSKYFWLLWYNSASVTVCNLPCALRCLCRIKRSSILLANSFEFPWTVNLLLFRNLQNVIFCNFLLTYWKMRTIEAFVQECVKDRAISFHSYVFC